MTLSKKNLVLPESDASTMRLRFHYLDGIRGLAALVVLFHHAYGFAIGDDIWHYPRIFAPIYHSFLYAHYAVGVFIVLSGYCLMLPVVRSGSLSISGGLRSYFHRRAWRILPPYYAALITSTSVVILLSLLHRQSDMAPPFTSAGLVSFILLVHNLNPAWAGQINPALWSVASEWQIYFVFPFILLPLWRRFGPLVVLGITFLATSVPYIAVPGLKFLLPACPWYITLFALGMLGAYVSCSELQNVRSLRSRLPWQFAPLALIVASASLVKLLSHSKAHWVSDVALGIIFSSFLVYCTVSVQRNGGERLPPALRFLGSAPVVSLGKFSYSIYLLHLPLIALMNVALQGVSFRPVAFFVFVIPLEMLTAVAFSYVFHVVWERRFLKPPSDARVNRNPSLRKGHD